MEVRFAKNRVLRYSKNAEEKDPKNNSCGTMRWVRNKSISGKKLERLKFRLIKFRKKKGS